MRKRAHGNIYYSYFSNFPDQLASSVFLEDKKELMKGELSRVADPMTTLYCQFNSFCITTIAVIFIPVFPY